MKIAVKSDGANIRLFLPLWLIKSKMLQKIICKKDPSGTLKNILKNRELLKNIYRELKNHKGMVLVEVTSPGAFVKITI